MGKKEEILEQALKLFSLEGYENVGIQKIVDSADVKKPTLYHYFGSKQGLLISLLDTYFNPILAELEAVCKYSGDIVKTLEDVTTLYFDFGKNNQDIYKFIQSMKSSSLQSEARLTIESYKNREFNMVKNIFILAENDHGNMKGRSFNFALTFLGVIGAFITSFYDGECQLNNDVVYQSCRQFMYGIFS
ncbi:MAG: TetR/AcrR family transcriptional regulator [Spirochaetales bacterium]|nr:TetR/AcrR family transcriptional regulator [Spirochaetales bacterium]